MKKQPQAAAASKAHLIVPKPQDLDVWQLGHRSNTGVINSQLWVVQQAQVCEARE